VICSTRELQKVIFQYTGSGALVIPDPYEGQVRSPSFSPEFPRVKVLWFGHESNIKTLINNASDIYEACKDFPIELIVVSGQAIFEGELANLLDRVFGEPIMLRKVLWSALKVYELFDQVDCVYIPTLSGPYYSVKSSNRMLEALIGGKLVIAGDSPSHRELPGFVSIGQGLRASLADAIVNKPATVTKIISAQDFVVRTYSPFRIAMLWNEAFTSGSPEQQRPKIRLNLGCGDKILTTYINVDLISGRKGRRPDLASDVSDLRSIGDGTVDEILAVHIFEHFYLWEVPKLLSEWARVLRSGGKIVIECPNLAAACAEFHSPHSPGTGDQNFDANTMWVFYGDPSWKDPLMCHRWGYTPSSLASLLSAHGFVHVRQEPAEFKKREPRDMRLVAEKC
jgi:hypothetical protein